MLADSGKDDDEDCEPQRTKQNEPLLAGTVKTASATAAAMSATDHFMCVASPSA